MAQDTSHYPHSHNVTFARGAVMTDAQIATASLKRILDWFKKEETLHEIYDVQPDNLQQAISLLQPLCKEPTMTTSPKPS